MILPPAPCRSERLYEVKSSEYSCLSRGPPEAAILGVSRGRIEPVYIDGAFQPRTMLPLSLSYDHRVIDGADAARFVRWIVDALEQPLTLLLDN